MDNEKKEAVKYYEPKRGIDILMDDTLEAVDMRPAFSFDVKYKKPGIICKWCNWRSREGHDLFIHQSMGGEFATVDDVETVLQPNKEGKFVIDDVVLIKFPERVYNAAIKANVVRSYTAATRGMAEAKQKLDDHLASLRDPAIKQQLQQFDPPPNEVQRAVENSAAQRSKGGTLLISKK
jgi:hypothetical protein